VDASCRSASSRSRLLMSRRREHCSCNLSSCAAFIGSLRGDISHQLFVQRQVTNLDLVHVCRNAPRPREPKRVARVAGNGSRPVLGEICEAGACHPATGAPQSNGRDARSGASHPAPAAAPFARSAGTAPSTGCCGSSRDSHWRRSGCAGLPGRRIAVHWSG
jgi:hypothetical protein